MEEQSVLYFGTVKFRRTSNLKQRVSELAVPTSSPYRGAKLTRTPSYPRQWAEPRRRTSGRTTGYWIPDEQTCDGKFAPHWTASVSPAGDKTNAYIETQS